MEPLFVRTKRRQQADTRAADNGHQQGKRLLLFSGAEALFTCAVNQFSSHHYVLWCAIEAIQVPAERSSPLPCRLTSAMKFVCLKTSAFSNGHKLKRREG
jgi:hypothetical protein